MKSILYLIIFSFLITSCQVDVERQTEHKSKKPNILLVVADDMGWTDLGSFGSEIETPHLDALASEGVKFTNFHASMSCSPTRSMLLSGTDNHIAGLGNMGELLTPEQKGKPGYEGYLNKNVVSLAEVLKDNGYHTYMAGKWHLGHQAGQYPADRGFEESLSMLNGGSSYWSDMIGLMPAEAYVKYVRNEEVLTELPKDFYSTRNFTDFLINQIRKNKDDGKPFLAYLAFNAPHDPMHVPEPWQSKYEGLYDEGYDVLKHKRTEAAKDLGLIPETAPEPQPVEVLEAWDALESEQQAVEKKAMEVYAGMVSNMDYHYGRIVNFLKDIGEYENTIVVFLSDNGSNPWFSEQYPGVKGSEWVKQFDNSVENIGDPMSHFAYGLGWGSASAGPLNWFKLTMGEGGIRTPLFISAPGIKGKTQTDGFAYVWDLMPTILDLTGIPHPDEYKGKPVEAMMGNSLQKVLKGEVNSIYGPEDFICGELGGAGSWVRQGDMKAVFVSPPYGDGKWHLFDLSVDPGETNDLAESDPKTLEVLLKAYDQYADKVGIVR